MIECEVKLKIDSAENIKRKLVSLGFTECESLTETDTYFDNKNGDIRHNDSALRIRQTIDHASNNEYCQINFKGKKLDKVSMSRPEYESEFYDSDAMTNILASLGFMPVSPQVVKNRTLLRHDSYNACIDDVKGLGYFLELETIVETEEEKKQGLLKIEAILNELGYKISDTTTKSYLSQLQG